MSLFVLDTDILTLWLRGHARVSERIAAQQTLHIAALLRVLAFDRAAIQRFNKLRTQKLRVGTNDLKIAATVLENQAFLVTRNQSDFQQIPDLALEDWSQ